MRDLLNERAIGAAIFFVAVIVAAFVLVTHKPDAANATGENSTVCFSRASWDADPGDRPCARVVRVYEDASVCVRVGPADHSVSKRVCVGNPYD